MKQRILCFFALLLLSVSLFSCASPALKRDGKVYVHEKTGIAYRFASSAYTAEASGEAIARLVRDVAGEEALYAIDGLATDQYLVTEAGRLLCAEEIVLPTLSELIVSEAKLYSYELNMATAAIVSDSGQLQELKSICSGGAVFDADKIAPQTEHDSYELRFFAAGEHAGLIYTMQYWQCSETVFVYERIGASDDAEELYPDVSYTLLEEDGEVYARFDFGRSLIYDPISGTCRSAGGILASHFSE